MSVLEQVQDDVRTAMKARDRGRASALRMVVDVLQQDAKLGKGDDQPQGRGLVPFARFQRRPRIALHLLKNAHDDKVRRRRRE